jgi:hypothetical protein
VPTVCVGLAQAPSARQAKDTKAIFFTTDPPQYDPREPTKAHSRAPVRRTCPRPRSHAYLPRFGDAMFAICFTARQFKNSALTPGADLQKRAQEMIGYSAVSRRRSGVWSFVVEDCRPNCAVISPSWGRRVEEEPRAVPFSSIPLEAARAETGPPEPPKRRS